MKQDECAFCAKVSTTLVEVQEPEGAPTTYRVCPECAEDLAKIYLGSFREVPSP